MYRLIPKRKERGATVVEMSIAGTVLCLTIFGIIEFGRLMLTNNGLNDAVRRGARYAVMSTQNTTAVKNVAVYGDPNPPTGTSPLVTNLTPSNVSVTYTSDFGIKQGSVTVKITNYTFSFVVPLIGATINMGEYKTTLTGEAAGFLPPTI